MALQRLRVYGNRILDADGKDVTTSLIGVTIEATDWCPQFNDRFATETQFKILNAWGIKVIQIEIPGWSEWATNAAVRSRLDDILDLAEAHDIYVHISGWFLTPPQAKPYNNDMSTWTDSDWDYWIDYWSSNPIYGIAKRYAGRTVIMAYALLDEPLYLNWDTQQTRFRECIDAIRAEDPDVMINVEESSQSNWYDRSLLFEQTYPISRSNILFSIHGYWNWIETMGAYGLRWDLLAGTKENCRTYLSWRGGLWCLANNRAVQIGQTNARSGSIPDGNGAIFLRNWYEVLLEDGYAGWFTHWWRVDVGNGYPLIEDWDGLPSWQGEILQNYLSPIITHMLTVTATIGGTTTPDIGTHTYNEGTIVVMTASSNTNYRFDHWELDTGVFPQNPINLLMNNNHTIHAVFEFVPTPPVTSTINGIVKDAKTAKPLVGATVTCDGYTDVTEIDGSYEFKDIPATQYTLTAQMVGYEIYETTVDTTGGGNFTVDFEVAPPTSPVLNTVAPLTVGLILTYLGST